MTFTTPHGLSGPVFAVTFYRSSHYPSPQCLHATSPGQVVVGRCVLNLLLENRNAPCRHLLRVRIQCLRRRCTRDPNTGTAKAISWIIPNEANLGSLDDYLVTIADLEELLGASYVAINAPASLKNMLPASTWTQPAGCDLS